MFLINNKNLIWVAPLPYLSGFPVLNTHISSLQIPRRVTYSTTIYQTFYSNKLPIAYTLEEYGKIIIDNPNYAIINLNTKTFIIIEKSLVDNKVVYNIKYLKNSNIMFTWTDTFIEPNYIIREIGKSTYHYKDYNTFTYN